VMVKYQRAGQSHETKAKLRSRTQMK
jgi:hypothetical protein